MRNEVLIARLSGIESLTFLVALARGGSLYTELLDQFQCLLQSQDIRVFLVHLEEIDEMGEIGAVKATLSTTMRAGLRPNGCFFPYWALL